MKKLIFIITLILLAVLFNLKPATIQVNNDMANQCYADMQKNDDLMCD